MFRPWFRLVYSSGFLIMKRTNIKSESEKMVRTTRSKGLATKSEESPLVSSFKLKSKQKLSHKPNISDASSCSDLIQDSLPETTVKTEVKTDTNKPLSPTKKSTKREHIKVKYDEPITSPKKLKNILSAEKPANWEEVLSNLRQMRKEYDAPVDSLGPDGCSDHDAAPEVFRYQALLSLMLSSQTKDQITHAAMMKLREHGCTIDQILATSDEELGKLIYPVSFWKNKVKYIKKTTEMLKEEFSNDIPNTVENLCKLPGVGPKMAHLCMITAWNVVTGIGVDTHVHRVCNRLGWVQTKTPEETRKALEAWLPKELWSEVNLLIVGFGQQRCSSVKPHCGTCLNRELCPFGRKSGIKKGKKGDKVT